MPTVTISNAAMDAIRAAALHPLRQTGVRVGPDQWRVPLAQDTLDRIDEAKLAGESISDAILRVCSGRPQ